MERDLRARFFGGTQAFHPETRPEVAFHRRSAPGYFRRTLRGAFDLSADPVARATGLFQAFGLSRSEPGFNQA